MRDSFKRFLETVCFRSLLIGTLIVIAVIFATKPNQYQPRNPHSGQAAKGQIADYGPFGIGPEGWTAIFTGVLAVFTFILSGVSITQIYFLRESNETARIAADAATQSAEALEASERAHIVELIEGGDFSRLFQLASWYPKSSEMATQSETLRIPIHLRFKNYGKTPATIIAYGAGTLISNGPPEFDQIAKGDRLLEEPTLEEKGGTLPFDMSALVPNTWQQSMQLREYDLQIWFIGSVTYLDVFDTQTTRQFIWLYEHPMRRLVPGNTKTTRQQKGT